MNKHVQKESFEKDKRSDLVLLKTNVERRPMAMMSKLNEESSIENFNKNETSMKNLRAVGGYER